MVMSMQYSGQDGGGHCIADSNVTFANIANIA